MTGNQELNGYKTTVLTHLEVPLNHAANSSWLRNRHLLGRGAASQISVAPLPHYSQALDRAMTSTMRLLPSWIYLAMIVIATAAICVTVNLRGHRQVSSAEQQFRLMQTEIEGLRKTNASLQSEVLRITTEPATIESAARARLGMVRPTDVVVPLQSRSATHLASLSFVR